MNKKGFTLIELLAVIVILAVITLIATPIILNVIEESKKGAAEQSAKGYINAIENQVMLNEVDSSKKSIADGIHCVEELNNLGVEVKGQAPDNGNVYIENGIVKKYIFGIGEYVVENGITTKSTNKEKYENGYAVYYNPVSGKICSDYVEDNSKNENKVGCMKWYIFNDTTDSSTINMILDHNTTSNIVYNSTGSNSEMLEVKKQLNDDTETWKNIARLITANEVATISGNTNFNSNLINQNPFYLGSNSNDTSKRTDYVWLYDYTYKCDLYGCLHNTDKDIWGYWTSDAYLDSTNHAWFVTNSGQLAYGVDRNNVTSNFAGIRPVITISESLIK